MTPSGKKLIEEFFPRIDLTHVIDTSGAYIPGHGTPTVILFGRDRPPVGQTVRAVLGIRGEPSTPADPAQGQVWRSIVNLLDSSGAENDFVSVTDVPRETFARHPWSIGGGGAAELKQQLDSCANSILKQVIESIGFMAITGEDDVFVVPKHILQKNGLNQRVFGVGEFVRDWHFGSEARVLFLYDDSLSDLPLILYESSRSLEKFLWHYRTTLRRRKMFGKSPEELGLRWYEYVHFIRERALAPLLIAYAEVATHNHFVLDRGGKVFNRTAPIIKLPTDATEHDHLALLGLLNSSTVCFWMKQVFFNKGAGGGTRVQSGRSPLGDESWESHFAFDGTKLKLLPLVEPYPIALGKKLDELMAQRKESLPAEVILQTLHQRADWDRARTQSELILQEMITWQAGRIGLVLLWDLWATRSESLLP